MLKGERVCVLRVDGRVLTGALLNIEMAHPDSSPAEVGEGGFALCGITAASDDLQVREAGGCVALREDDSAVEERSHICEDAFGDVDNDRLNCIDENATGRDACLQIFED